MTPLQVLNIAVVIGDHIIDLYERKMEGLMVKRGSKRWRRVTKYWRARLIM